MTEQEREAAKGLTEPFYYRSSSPPSGEVRTPAEFEPSEAVIVHIPMYSATQDFFGKMVHEIVLSGATPYLLVANASEASTVTKYFLTPYGTNAGSVEFLYARNDAFWARDFGPYFARVDGERAIIDMRYYPTRPNDDQVPLTMAEVLDEDVYSAPLSTEGGNFMTDGLGTCWVSQGVLHANQLSQSQVRGIYESYLGCETVRFITPLPGEGTTHVDMFSKILDKDTILVAYSESRLGANSAQIDQLERAAQEYASTPKPGGGSWNIVRIPLVIDNYNGVINAYTNSLIVNNAVIVPTYGYATDEQALQVYRNALPGYRVVGVPSSEIIPMGGSVHCTTMQVPTDSGPTDDVPGDLTTLHASGSIAKDDYTILENGWIQASAGAFSVQMTGSGDADLYVWKDVSSPSWTNFTCRPYLDGTAESCALSGPGRFLVAVRGYASSSTYDVAISFTR